MTPKQKTYRLDRIKLVHVAKRELGLDEPTYRAILFAQGGNESLSAMSLDGMNRVIDYFKAQGFKLRKAAGDRKQATGADAKKVRALWLFLHELGAVRDPSESALSAYVKRIAGVDDVQWMHGTRKVPSNPAKREQDRAELTIESLKKWAMRFLPADIDRLKSLVRERHAQGLLNPEQLERAEAAFGAALNPQMGFDRHLMVWENLRIAMGRPYPPTHKDQPND